MGNWGNEELGVECWKFGKLGKSGKLGNEENGKLELAIGKLGILRTEGLGIGKLGESSEFKN